MSEETKPTNLVASLLVRWLTYAGKNGPTEGSFRAFLVLVQILVAVISILAYRVLSDYETKQEDQIKLGQDNARKIGDIQILLTSKIEERDREITSISNAIDSLRTSVGNVENRTTAIESQLRWARGKP